VSRADRGPVEVVRSSVVPAPRGAVWARVTTPEGIADEFRPLLTMTMPRGLRGATIADVTPGEPLGRAWIMLGGLVPVEYDDLVVVELDPPHHFHERSALGSCRVWEHRRELVDLGDGTTRVTDTLRARPRALVPRRLVGAVTGALFSHRHRRLSRPSAWSS
jgi:ligand-binding SRPBCC domain-containing protein